MPAFTLTRGTSIRLLAALLFTLGVAFFATELLRPGDGEAGPLLLLILGIMAGAWYGGLLSGLTATVVAALFAAYYVMPPVDSFAIALPSSRLNLLFFVLGGIFVSCLCEVRRRAGEDCRAARRSEFQVLAEVSRLRAELSRAAADRDQLQHMIERHLRQIGAAPPESLRHAGASILRYLQFARPESPDRIDCAKVVQAAIDRCDALLQAHGGNVLCDRLPAVEGDYTQLVALFTELITNALKFHGAERPKIRIACAPVGGGWQFVVSDNGAGIEKAKWNDVFQPFEPGLGLALCRRIVENHNGRISLESMPGNGTTIRFTVLRPAAPAAVWTFSGRGPSKAQTTPGCSVAAPGDA